MRRHRRPHGVSASLRAWGICVLMLLATMLNYMDRQALAQQATEISRDLRLTNQDYGRLEFGFGMAFAVGGMMTGFAGRPVQPALDLPGGAVRMVGRRLRDRLGHNLPRAVRLPGPAGFLRVRAMALRLVTAQRLLSRRDRTLGNSILQSGASLGAIATPLVVLLLTSERAKGWRLPFRVIGAVGVFWIVAWLTVVRSRTSISTSRPCRLAAEDERLLADATTDAEVAAPDRAAYADPPVPGPGGRRDQHQPLLAVFPRLDADDAGGAVWLLPGPSPVFLGRLLPRRGRRLHRGRFPGQVAHDARLLGPRSTDDRVPRLLPCSTALSTLAAFLPASSMLLVTLLLVGFGSLGQFPLYYAFTQELSTRRMGKVTGVLSFLTWISNALLQGAESASGSTGPVPHRRSHSWPA